MESWLPLALVVFPVLLVLAADFVDFDVDLADLVDVAFVDLVDLVDVALVDLADLLEALDFVALVDLVDFLAAVLVPDLVADPVDLLERRPVFLDFAFSAIAATACSKVTDS